MAPSRYLVPSVQRAARILRAVSSSGRAVGVSELSRHLDLPKSTVFRIVLTLESEGLLQRVDGDRYRVGVLAFEIGCAYATRLDLESAFRRIARQLVRDHNETVQLAILAGRDILYIGREECSQPVRLVSTLGARLPAHATGLGKALLAALPEAELETLYPDGRLPQLTPNTLSSLPALLAELDRTRQRGWAHDREEAALGLQCVGSAIRNGDGPAVAAISIALPSQRMTGKLLALLGAAVREGAEEISWLIGSCPARRSD